MSTMTVMASTVSGLPKVLIEDVQDPFLACTIGILASSSVLESEPRRVQISWGSLDAYTDHHSLLILDIGIGIKVCQIMVLTSLTGCNPIPTPVCLWCPNMIGPHLVVWVAELLPRPSLLVIKGVSGLPAETCFIKVQSIRWVAGEAAVGRVQYLSCQPSSVP